MPGETRMRKKMLLLACVLIFCATLLKTETINVHGDDEWPKGISTISVSPATITVNQVDETFTVNFTITNAPNMTQFIVNNITWNPAILQLNTGSDSDFVEGPFLKSFGSTVFMIGPVYPDEGRAEEVTCALISNYVTPNSSGLIFSITFRSKAVGESPIDIGFAILLCDLDVADEPTLQGGIVTVVPEFSSAIILLLLLSTTAIAIAAKKFNARKQPKYTISY